MAFLFSCSHKHESTQIPRSPSSVNFVMIFSNEGEKIYQDVKSALLWGSRFPYETNFYGASKVCDIKNDNEYKWRLPTVDEYYEAEKNGIKQVFQAANHWFWTSSTQGKKNSRDFKIWLWDSQASSAEVGHYDETASVRCVGTK
jgi:hypothetical protein